MNISLEVEFSPGLKKKMEPDHFKKVVSNALKDVTLEAERRCKTECPVDTGRLRRSHSTAISPQQGEVRNSTDYVGYVVDGTYKMKANNYPSRVLASMNAQKVGTNAMRMQLKGDGF